MYNAYIQMGVYAQLHSARSKTAFLETGIIFNEPKQRKLLVLNLCKRKYTGRFSIHKVQFEPDKINNVFLFDVNGYAFA